MAFQCNTTGYQVVGNPSSIYEVNLVTGNLSAAKASYPVGLNAIGFNPTDNLIYGISTSSPYTVYKIDDSYNISSLPWPTGLPIQSYTLGAFDTKGYYYITDPAIGKYYVIDYNVNSLNYGKLVDPTNSYAVQAGPNYGVSYSNVSSIGMSDWAFNPQDGYLYGIDDGGSAIRKLNPTTGVVTDLTSTGLVLGQNYGSVFSYANGVIFAIGNSDGILYRIQLDPSGTSGSAIKYATSGTGINSDGTSCILASYFIDFGDAPDMSPVNSAGNYSTTIANNGPRHGMVSDLMLGTKVTSEFDAHQSLNAIGDDIVAGIQDDGLTTPVSFKQGTTNYTLNVSYTNNTSSNANLYGWFDYNMDGVFQLEEAINGGIPVVVPPSTTNPKTVAVSFSVPSGQNLNVGDITYLRLRLTTDTLLNANAAQSAEDTRSIGPASDGEVEDYVVSIAPADPFTCNQQAYQVVQKLISPGVYGNSQFRSVDPVTGNVTTINYDTGYVINAIGYNTLDNYVYGIADVGATPEHLVKISSTGVVIDLGVIPNLSLTGGIDVGAFDNNGLFYIKRATDPYYYTVDLRPTSINYGKLVSPVSPYNLAVSPYYTNITPSQATGGDWTYNVLDGKLYTNTATGFKAINPATGALTAITTTYGTLPSDYSSMFSDSNGYIYGISDSTGQIIQWKNNGGTMQGALLSQSSSTIFSDAAFCLNAAVLIDFGDAPDTSASTSANNYNTLLINNGPRHALTDNLKIGAFVTSESDAYQNPTATGDDIPLGIQDDGLIYPVTDLVIGDKTYSLEVGYFNDTGSPAVIYGWIDFNRDGIFEVNEASNLVTVTSDPVNQRQTTLVFNIPSGVTLTPGDTTFVRLRITSDPLANNGILSTSQDSRSVGAASNGEVEDYIITYTELNVTGVIWYDLNCDGVKDPGELLAPNIVVQLYEVGNSIPINSTVTDVNGAYSFNNLPSGNYYVKVVLPNGYSFSSPSTSSNIDKLTGNSAEFNLSANNTLETVGAGLCKCNTVSGRAFYDCNMDGILEDGEPYLCGVTVQLINSTGVVQDTVTDCEGYYEFTGVCPGIYTVQTIAPPEMYFAVQNNTAYYGSRPSATTGNFIINLTNLDYTVGFLGFVGPVTLDLKYCTGCQCNLNSNASCKNGKCTITLNR